MTVDDTGEVLKRIKEKYPSVGAVKRPAGRPFVDYSSHDPEGNIFDIAEPGKKQLVGVFTEVENKRPRHIKHFTIRAMNPSALAQYYMDVFEFKEEEKALEDPNFYLTDGTLTMVIAPYKIQDYLGTEHKRPGFDHIGFESKTYRLLKMTSRSWRSTTLSIWLQKHPMSNPSIKSSWTCFEAAGTGSINFATRRETCWIFLLARSQRAAK
jgi:hypothetical protein